MFRILAIFISLASGFLIFSVLAAENYMPQGDFSELKRTGTAKVIEIVNPLTVKLEDGRSIHLAGLDYPDLDFYEPGDLSVTAVKILDDFLKNKHVRIYQTKDAKIGRTNRMGQYIAHLARTDNEVWVQGLMLKLGVARVRTTQNNTEMGLQMLALEDEARQIKAGMWEMEQFQVLSPELASKHIGSYQTVEGTIKTVSKRKNTLFLNFGHNWRDDFTVGITTQNLKSFSKQNIDPQQWSGKPVRVRGWLESYNGPYINVDHAEQFEMLFETLPDQETTANIPAGNALPQTYSDTNAQTDLHKKNDGSALPVFND